MARSDSRKPRCSETQADPLRGGAARATTASNENAAAEACPFVDLFEARIDRACLSRLTAREAWERLVLPVGFEDGVLRCVTTRANLRDAEALLRERLDVPFSLGVTNLVPLEQFIAQLYNYEGIAA